MATVFAASVSLRAYFSAYHLWAAQRFAKHADAIEDDAEGFNIANRAFVTGAVLSAAAFLEAAINEIYDDVVDGHEPYVGLLSASTKACLTHLWTRRNTLERVPTLRKYQRALECAGLTAFDEGKQPYEDAALLVQLRNTLVHARPVTRETGYMSALDNKLRDRFPANRPMAKMGNPYFPDQCLGAGCAFWSVTAATNLADEFFRRFGVTPNYQRDKKWEQP
jgi:hypothetical protein